ncbi:ARM repeat protein interacting with ABF2 [Auxenochlorella protothecoides]|uniref:ARM repeat protein interacting with ABF2 n=1 Tax=Auxenochlorella protothecoides TaxID=3075 RepID=A0A087SFS6_AUXPR|nr:ARM repeat protein interacting with ABF2 [Auxenochlorella protothecoides]KFM24580.1 ARM repeat protein interacting with ABF2 [Auxenochlorella protothecoides]
MSDSSRKRRLAEVASTSLNVLTMGSATTTDVSHKIRLLLKALLAEADPLKELQSVKTTVRALLEICKNGEYWDLAREEVTLRQGPGPFLQSPGTLHACPPARGDEAPLSPLAEENLDAAAREGTVGAVVPLLKQACGSDDPSSVNPPVEVEELERDICFLLGLLAIKVAHQQAICKAGALRTLVALNNAIKDRVRGEGGVPHLVALLSSVDPKVQRAVAGSLRTLAFKNEENKALIVALGALPLLVQMLHAEDTTLHYEAVGVVGNLVHSSAPIKRAVLEAGALQPIINLLSSPCPDSQREAALLLGQFATEGEYKFAIVQRGAVAPLIEMLAHADTQLREMAAFALGRLAQNADNQAGIIASGGLLPLMDLLESRLGNLQHNAAFALYGLSDNDDNLIEFVREGVVQRILACDMIVQPSRDCVAKTLKRLQERLRGRVLAQILYNMQGAGGAARARIAVALAALTTPDSPSPAANRVMFLEKRTVHVLVDALTDPHTPGDLQAQAAASLMRVAEACGATSPLPLDPEPPEPQRVYLGPQYVNSRVESDVTFQVEGRPFYAHRIALQACSDIFRSMFDGHYRETDASVIPIPNIRWEVWEATMRCIYCGSVAVPPEAAQELLAVSDQYMLDTLKRLCEAAIAEGLTPDNVSAAFELAEGFNAPDLAKRCVLFCLAHHAALVAAPGGSRAGYAVAMQRMAPRLHAALAEHIARNADAAAASAGAAEAGS